jgi:uncharacterized membrane protein (DUF2068 family)
MPTTHHTHPRGLMIIAAFKFLKGLSLLGVGIAVQVLAFHEAHEIQNWADLLRIDPHNHYMHLLLDKLPFVDAHQLREVSLGTFVYSALYFTEGVGLFLRKRWAEILTVISTAGLIPLEVYELFHRFGPLKLLILLFNLAIVAYLIFEVRRVSRLLRTESPEN